MSGDKKQQAEEQQQQQAAAAAAAPSKKSLKKEEKKAKKDAKEELPASAIKIFLHGDTSGAIDNAKVAIVASYLKLEAAGVKDTKEVDDVVMSLPAIKDDTNVLFGATSSILYLLAKAGQKADVSLTAALLRVDSVTNALIAALVSADAIPALATHLESYESAKSFEATPVLGFVLYPVFYKALQVVGGVTQLNDPKLNERFPYLVATTLRVHKSDENKTAQLILAGKLVNSKSLAETSTPADASSASAVVEEVPKGVIPNNVNWESMGLISGLKMLFNAAILAAYPESQTLPGLESAVVSRCANANFGDFQCNNALALSKALKGLEGYTGKTAPKDIADRISRALPENPLVLSAIAAPNGFINIKLATETITSTIASVLSNQYVSPPELPSLNVLVDFSSPNIAKEMHVGHLRSTIIGDCLSRLFEFVGYKVNRVNHVGDWGTQFGMLITYLLEEYPDILTNPPNISDLTAIYKESKRRFDANETFKEQSRLNVVNLQSGDSTCRQIWQLLCDISRQEFQKVYDILHVNLEEYGESYYNSMIPGVIEELERKGLVENDNGMLMIKLPHFTIPLIVRKTDGGYGYDSTDMAALKHRLFTLQCDWIVYITDAGQGPHFHMCFDAGKAAGWLQEAADAKTTTTTTGEKKKEPRLDHIGFGVVCGEDGKRFKTRSSETVRLIDLLNAAKDRMKESLQQRQQEGRSAVMNEEEMEETCQRIGYGAVKYFDLKQHPGTNYIFNYDRMLDTKGDTAVYLMFAYARVVSILRKAKEEKTIDITTFLGDAKALLTKCMSHPSERALAFELLQFGDMIQYVLQELLPNRLCDYLKEICVKFTDFVTKCHVLNGEDMDIVKSRLLLCEVTRLIMLKCFELLGIQPVDRI